MNRIECLPPRAGIRRRVTDGARAANPHSPILARNSMAVMRLRKRLPHSSARRCTRLAIGSALWSQPRFRRFEFYRMRMDVTELMLSRSALRFAATGRRLSTSAPSPSTVLAQLGIKSECRLASALPVKRVFIAVFP